jgi:hypothetical protein
VKGNIPPSPSAFCQPGVPAIVRGGTIIEKEISDLFLVDRQGISEVAPHEMTWAVVGEGEKMGERRVSLLP